MKRLSIILITISLMVNAVTVNAALVPRESAPCNATEHQIIVAENEEKVRAIIAEVITQYANGEINYTKAKFSTSVKIYQSINLPILT